MQRLLDSAKIYRMEVPFTLEELCAGVVETIEANGVALCYIRPIALRGYGEIGVNPKGSPVDVYIANFPWGKYLAGHGGADVCVSSWNRLAPNTMPALAKAGANYMNSQLIKMETGQWLSRRYCAGRERVGAGRGQAERKNRDKRDGEDGRTLGHHASAWRPGRAPVVWPAPVRD